MIRILWFIVGLIIHYSPQNTWLFQLVEDTYALPIGLLNLIQEEGI